MGGVLFAFVSGERRGEFALPRALKFKRAFFENPSKPREVFDFDFVFVLFLFWCVWGGGSQNKGRDPDGLDYLSARPKTNKPHPLSLLCMCAKLEKIRNHRQGRSIVEGRDLRHLWTQRGEVKALYK